MNDRFKFRVWDVQEQKYLYFDLSNKGSLSDFEFFATEESPDYNEQIKCPDSNCCALILEQCTGLRDKNGKLIYEGDIVGNKKYVHEIVWSNKDASFHTKLKGMGFICGHLEQSWIDEFGFEIIGNIHENPEILNV